MGLDIWLLKKFLGKKIVGEINAFEKDIKEAHDKMSPEELDKLGRATSKAQAILDKRIKDKR